MSEKRKIDLNEFQQRFRRRYLLKKTVNLVMSCFITFSGITAILYSVFVYGASLIDRLRYMTFDGTIYTIIISAFFSITCIIEAVYEIENTSRFVYFLRLSSAVTEFIIFAVVMFGMTSLVPDKPDIVSYTGFIMHIVIPVMTLACFIFNDAPIGKVKPLEPLHGSWYITAYAVVMVIIFGFGILPPEKAPYSFLDFKHSSIWFCIACGIGIYVLAYGIAALLIRLNSKLSWSWFYGLKKPKKNSLLDKYVSTIYQ